MEKKLNRRDFLKASSITAASCGVALIANPLAAGATTVPSTPSGSKWPEIKCENVPLPESYNTLATDVIVVGAGCSGIEAAINVLKAGANVILIDKKMVGRCGNSGQHTSGAMASANNFANDGDNLEEHMLDAVKTGKYVLDQKLGEEVLKAYRDDAVTLKSENYGNLHLRDPKTGKPEFALSRTKKRRWEGYRLQNQTFEAIRLGAKVMDYCTVTRVLTDKDNNIVGVAAIDYKSGNFFIVRAKSVILATGGGSSVWGGSTSSKEKVGSGSAVGMNVGCAYGLTGDGHAMAASVGATFKDMEFRATAPCSIVLAGANVCYMCPDLTVMTDKNGRKFIDEIPKKEMSFRRIFVEQERVRKRGECNEDGSFGLPVKSLKPVILRGNGEYVEVEGWGFFQPHPMAFMKMWQERGLNLLKATSTNLCLYDYGGAVTDIHGRTNVPGLYAVGEMAMHCGAEYGAFRVFSSSMAIGKRTGEDAAQFAKDHDYAPLDFKQVADTYQNAFVFFTRKGGISVRELKRKVQNAAWNGAGGLKSDSKAKKALVELAEAKQEYYNLSLRDTSRICNTEWMEAMQIPGIIKYAEMATLAGMTRTESRGSHLRAEYEYTDNDNWLKNIYLQEKNGKMEVSTKPVVVTKYKLPSGKTSMGGGVLTD